MIIGHITLSCPFTPEESSYQAHGNTAVEKNVSEQKCKLEQKNGGRYCFFFVGNMNEERGWEFCFFSSWVRFLLVVLHNQQRGGCTSLGLSIH